MSSTMLLPRLRLDDGTVAKLKQMSDERGMSVGAVIGKIIEGCLNADLGERETLNRTILVGERMGLVVGGPTTFPPDWHRLGGLTHEECREIAAGYLVWKRENDEK